jgi:DNA-binding XRE family transcriptional regulator
LISVDGKGIVPKSEQRRREIGALIAEVRGERRWSQGVVAHKLNVDKSVVSKLENGRTGLEVERARALIAVLQFTSEQEARLWQLQGVHAPIDDEARRLMAGSDDHVASLVTGLPPRPDGYIEDVDLQGDLQRVCEGARLALVHGIPGSGKTTLVGGVVCAIVAAGQRSIGRSVWLDVGRGGAIGGVGLCAAILEGVGERQDRVGSLSTEEAIVVALDALGRAPTVLVLDGFDVVLPREGHIPEDVETVLGGLAACATATTIIVSRTRVDSPHIDRHQTLHVAGLSQGAGERFAATLFPLAAEDIARSLARRVAHHPQAMALLRRHTATRGIGVEDLVSDDRVWEPALRRASGAILRDTELSQEHMSALRFLSALRSPLDPVVARYAAIAGVGDAVEEVLSSLEDAGLVYVDTGWVVHPVASAYAHDRQAASIADHVAAARMYEGAVTRAKDGRRDASPWQPWALESVRHSVVAGNLAHASEVLKRYWPTSHHIENGQTDAVYALWTTIKAAYARSDAPASVAGVRAALARLPTVAVQDMAISALCAGDHNAARDLMREIRDGRAGATEKLVRACIRYAGVMCRNRAADVALTLVQGINDQLVLVDSRAFPSVRIELLLVQARIAFERRDATGAIALCDEAIGEYARYRRETRPPHGGEGGVRRLMGKLLTTMTTTESAGVASPEGIDIAEMPAYARCIRAVCLRALGRHNDADNAFDDTLDLAAGIDGIGSGIHLFVLDHNATSLIAGREWDRALKVLRRRLSAMDERRRREAPADGTARMGVARAADTDGRRPSYILDRPSYIDVERAYYIDVLLLAGDTAGAEREARTLREELLSFEEAVTGRFYAYDGINRRQRWGLTVEMAAATSVRAMVQETMARVLLWGGRDEEAVRLHNDTMRIVRPDGQDPIVEEEMLQRIARVWDSARERVADGLLPMSDPETQLILPRRFFGNPAFVCRAKMGARYGASRVQGVLVYRRVLGRHYCLQGHRLYPF